jgi:hypothetical protein
MRASTMLFACDPAADVMMRLEAAATAADARGSVASSALVKTHRMRVRCRRSAGQYAGPSADQIAHRSAAVSSNAVLFPERTRATIAALALN